jgi:hypothetical protein
MFGRQVRDEEQEKERAKLSNYDVENIFMYHSPKEGQTDKYTALREKVKELAELMLELCPETRERCTALTNLEQSVMWANASIARN